VLFTEALVAAPATEGKALGANTAPVTLEVFSDYQCPACRDLYQQTLRPLMDAYVSTGKVYLIHRDFPLPMHKYARDAARYANAAARAGVFEKVEQALFAHQNEWSTTGDLDGTVAKALPPSEMRRVRKLLSDPETEAAIERDVALGKQNNVVKTTPTMVFTHRLRTYPVSGVIAFPILRRFIDDLLSR